jgi:hypothetical protein
MPKRVPVPVSAEQPTNLTTGEHSDAIDLGVGNAARIPASGEPRWVPAMATQDGWKRILEDKDR